MRLLVGALGLLVLLELGLRGLGLAFLATQNRGVESGPGERVTLLAIGESSTALGGAHAWPAQVARMLNAADLGLSFQAVNQGVPGVDSSTLVEKLPEHLSRWKPDVVMVMMGINDGKQAFLDLGDYEAPSPAVAFLRNFKVYRLFSFYELTRRDDWNRDKVRTEQAERLGWLQDRALKTGDAQALEEWVDALLHGGHREEAARILDERMAQAPTARVLALRARLHDLAGDGAARDSLLREATERWPQDPDAWWALASVGGADRLPTLRRQAERIPNARSWLDLSSAALQEGQLTEAMEAALNAVNAGAADAGMLALALALQAQGRQDEAGEAFYLAVATLRSGTALLAQARFQAASKDPEQAIQTLRYALEGREPAWPLSLPLSRDPDPGWTQIHLELARLLLEQGRDAEALEVLATVQPNPLTARNFQALLGQVLPSPGRVVVVQYPMRPLWPLRLTVPPRPGIVFVDNEATFQEALDRSGYDALFIDAYGGDFGHCTPEGNALVAANVATAIREAWYPGQ